MINHSLDGDSNKQEGTEAALSGSLERLRQNKALYSDNKYVQRVLNLNPNPQSLLMKRITNNMYKNKISSNAKHLGYNPLASQRGTKTDWAVTLPQNTQSTSQNRNGKFIQKQSYGVSRVLPGTTKNAQIKGKGVLDPRTNIKAGLSRSGGNPQQSGTQSLENGSSRQGEVNQDSSTFEPVNQRQSCATQINQRTEETDESLAQ